MSVDTLESLLHEIVARLSDIQWTLIEIRDQCCDTADDDPAEDTP